MDYPMRINKFLAHAGVCSRRQADVFISQKKVRINNKIAALGDRVQETDQVFVDDKLIRQNQKNVYIAFNKPVGIICTTNPEMKDNIVDFIKYPSRIYPIGRLDVKSSGLIFLTNDGSVVNKMMKGENKVEKEYLVDVDKTVTDDYIENQKKSFSIDHRHTIPAHIEKVGDKSYKIILVEGIKRQIRRMAEKYGYNIVHLKRIRIGGYGLGDLETGKWREVPEKEFKEKLGI